MVVDVSTIGLVGTAATGLMIVAMLAFVWLGIKEDRHRAQQFDDDDETA